MLDCLVAASGRQSLFVVAVVFSASFVVGCAAEDGESMADTDADYPIDLGGTGGGDEGGGTGGFPSDEPGWGDSGGAEPDPVCDGPVGGGACAELTACEAFGCGGKSESLNHYGCARQQCTAHADCGATNRCFVVALDEACLPGKETCAAVGGVCECTASMDCEGTHVAHCLPESVYPREEDCNVPTWACESLPERQLSLARSLGHHAVNDSVDLVADLGACSERVALARIATPCAESSCQVICEIGSCGAHPDVEACVAACEQIAAEETPEQIEAVVRRLAASPPLGEACSCSACDGLDTSLSVGLWAC